MKPFIFILFSVLCIYVNTAQTTIDYETQIQPIFDNSCMPCHSGNTPASGLNLNSYENVMVGGENGVVINIGDYENSTLWQEVFSGDMPNNIANNNMGIPDLNEEEIQLIADWILDLQCMVIDCLPEYICVLGECVCINDSDDNGICDEFESTNLLNPISEGKKVIEIIEILGKSVKNNTQNQIIIYIYDDGSVSKNMVTRL